MRSDAAIKRAVAAPLGSTARREGGEAAYNSTALRIARPLRISTSNLPRYTDPKTRKKCPRYACPFPFMEATAPGLLQAAQSVWASGQAKKMGAPSYSVNPMDAPCHFKCVRSFSTIEQVMKHIEDHADSVVAVTLEPGWTTQANEYGWYSPPSVKHGALAPPQPGQASSSDVDPGGAQAPLILPFPLPQLHTWPSYEMRRHLSRAPPPVILQSATHTVGNSAATQSSSTPSLGVDAAVVAAAWPIMAYDETISPSICAFNAARRLEKIDAAITKTAEAAGAWRALCDQSYGGSWPGAPSVEVLSSNSAGALTTSVPTAFMSNLYSPPMDLLRYFPIVADTLHSGMLEDSEEGENEGEVLPLKASSTAAAPSNASGIKLRIRFLDRLCSTCTFAAEGPIRNGRKCEMCGSELKQFSKHSLEGAAAAAQRRWADFERHLK